MLMGINQVAHQALYDALKNEVRKIANSEDHPSARTIGSVAKWYRDFQMTRVNQAQEKPSITNK